MLIHAEICVSVVYNNAPLDYIGSTLVGVDPGGSSIYHIYTTIYHSYFSTHT
jgi:hypothetical protein